MKRNLLFMLLSLVTILSLSASNKYVANYSLVVKDSVGLQQANLDSLSSSISHTASTLLDADGNAVDTSIVKLPNTYAWLIDTRFGDRILAPMDTVRENFHRSTLIESQGLAMSSLGHLGGPIQNKEFFAREGSSQFAFADPYQAWRRSPDKQLFLNTKIPYSNIQYQAGGGKEVAENHFKAELSSNFGKRLNVGFNFDYIYSRGYYKSLFAKQTSYDFNASYIGDKYKMHLFFGNNNHQSSANGGIMNDKYITSPESEDLQSFRGTSLDIPVMFEKGIRNKMRGRHVYLTNSYDIGKERELVQLNDTTEVWRKKKNYVAPASVILTTHYADQRRSLFSPKDVTDIRDQDLMRLDSLYVPNLLDENGDPTSAPKYAESLDDYMSHYTLTNTFAFRMNEGFQSWTKFSLTAFVEHEMRRFLLPGRLQYQSEKESDDVWFFGGRLSKNQGKNLKFNINAIKGITTSDLEIEGDLFTSFSLFGHKMGVKANVYFKNVVPDFFQENFSTRNIIYRDLGFSDTKRIYAGGEIIFPSFSFSETSISGGYENISNYIYLGEEKLGEYVKNQTANNFRIRPMQSSKNVNVLALKVDQKLKAGIFHLDLQGLLQKSTEEDIIPLPLWTVYANMYLKAKVSKVLTFQLGVDAYMHAQYLAPGYDLLYGQFYNQRAVADGGVKIGNFPHANAYVNLHLKYTRFFIMVYNIAESMGNRQSFTTPHYPNNPMMVRWGLSWRFNN